jgi:hypothetical protein
MIKKILISITLLLFFTGCNESKESQAQHDAKIIAKAKAEVREELQKEADSIVLKKRELSKTENKLAHLGVTKHGDTIIIDTNKTKTFLKIMANTMQEHMDKFVHDMKDGVIENKEAGIEINHSNITIDLNKTKSFIETWENTIRQYAKEFDKMSNDLDIKK